jgi:hypothetical protein
MVQPPPIVVRIAERTAQTSKGVVALRLHRVFDVHAGPSSRHDDLVLAEALQDGRVIRVRVVSYTIGGKTASTDQSAALAQSYEHPKPGDVFDEPFDARFLRDYHYTVNGRTIAFTSPIHDGAHGSGTFAIDASDNVTARTYTPNVFPRYATGGSVSDSRANVLSNYWAMTREVQQWRGHYGLFSGGATVVITQMGFRRFATAAQAASAIQTGGM